MVTEVCFIRAARAGAANLPLVKREPDVIGENIGNRALESRQNIPHRLGRETLAMRALVRTDSGRSK